MKNKMVPALFIIVIAFSMMACNLSANITPTPDLAATANAIASATLSAQDNQQATVNAAVAMTATAMPQAATPTPAVQVNYYMLTEEELAALIDQSVNEAMQASQAAYTSTSAATSNGTVTTDEVQTVQVYVSSAEYLLDEIDDMIDVYYDLYGDYASAALTELQQIEQDLNTISASLASINEILIQGAEQATAAINELNEAVQTINTKVSEAQTQAQGWSEQVKSELDTRQQQIANIQPNEIAANRAAALESVKKYATTLKDSIVDGKISSMELQNIAQLGANASAGITKSGGPQLADLSSQISNLTNLAARGNLPQLSREAPNFERSVQKRR